MSYYFDGAADYIYKTSVTVTAYPFTVSLWFYPYNDGTATSNTLWAQCRSTGSTTYYQWMQFNKTAGTVGATSRDSTTGGTGCTAGYVNFNEWNHVSAAFNTADRSIILNGDVAGKGRNTLSRGFPTSTNWEGFGRLGTSTAYDGKHHIGGAAIYNAFLTDDERVALANGFSPLKIRPYNLKSFQTFINSTRDIVQGNSRTVAGAVSSDIRPPMMQPPGVMYIPVPGAGGPPPASPIRLILNHLRQQGITG